MTMQSHQFLPPEQQLARTALPAARAYQLVWEGASRLMNPETPVPTPLREHVSRHVGALLDHIDERGVRNAEVARANGDRQVMPLSMSAMRRAVNASLHERSAMAGNSAHVDYARSEADRLLWNAMGEAFIAPRKQ